MISHSSPIAKALIGKAEADEIEFQAPGGIRRYEVLSVRYTLGESVSET
jgi:transcription elongation factor GreA